MTDPYATWDANLHLASDEHDGYPDTQMVPYIEDLRARGIVTLQSCQGHHGVADAALWVKAYFDSVALGIIRKDSTFGRVARLYVPEDCWEFVWRPERFKAGIEILSALAEPEEQA